MEDQREAGRLLVLFALALRVMLVSPSTASRACSDPDFDEAIEADEPPIVTTLAELRREDEATCTGYGFQPH